MRWITKGALLMLAACLAPFAQSGLDSINGFVKDPSGAVIPNATIAFGNEESGTDRRFGKLAAYQGNPRVHPAGEARILQSFGGRNEI